MTDIRTKEGREKLRRDYLRGYEAWGADPDQSVMLAALDGLGIAEKAIALLRDYVRVYPNNSGRTVPVLAEWDKWKGEPNPRPSP